MERVALRQLAFEFVFQQVDDVAHRAAVGGVAIDSRAALLVLTEHRDGNWRRFQFGEGGDGDGMAVDVGDRDVLHVAEMLHVIGFHTDIVGPGADLECARFNAVEEAEGRCAESGFG